MAPKGFPALFDIYSQRKDENCDVCVDVGWYNETIRKIQKQCHYVAQQTLRFSTLLFYITEFYILLRRS
jgi:hypothetical protein